MPDHNDGQIGFEQVGIASVLKRHRLQVPANQREYAWESEHVVNLFEDIARAIGESEPTYFLGTLVTISRGDSLEVVDGQQRLATTALLLHAIVEYLTSRDEMLADAISAETLFITDRRLRELVPRLALNLTDNHFFKSLLLGKGPTPTKPSHELLRNAAELARQRVLAIVAHLNENDHGDALNAWVEYLESRAAVVLLKVPDDANAYRMFETLNDRGLRVSQADLIKNYLYGRAQGRLPEVQEKWTLVRGALDNLAGDDTLIDFIRHSLIITSGFVRQAQLYDAVQRVARSPQQVATFAATLEELSGLYVAVQNAEHEHWNEYRPSTRRAIEVLNLLDIKLFRPVMLAAAARLGPRECGTTFELLVALGVRLYIASSTRTGTIEQALSGAATRIFSGDITTAAQLKTQLRDVTPTDATFRAAFETAKVSVARLSRYYLRSLETAISDLDSAWHIPIDDHSVINLEHILPRNSLGNWPQFGTAEEAKPYVSRLGNQALILFTDNSSLGSEAFAAKKQAFVKSPYHFTRMVADFDDWDSESINERQRQMAEVAVNLWKLP